MAEILRPGTDLSRRRPFSGFRPGLPAAFLWVAALMAAGLMLQLFGPPLFHLWRAPVSRFLGVLAAATVLIGLAAPESRPVRRLASPAWAVALIAALLTLSLLMGLTPQSAVSRPSLGWPDRLGLTRLAVSWPLALIYLSTVVCLGLASGRRCRRSGPKAVFLLNHLGLWLLLLTAALGAAERRAYVLWLEEGRLEWRGQTELGLIVDLPLAIELHGFEVEHYPPRLALINAPKGPGPVEEPDGSRLLQIDPRRSELGTTAGWSLELETFLPRAERGPDGTWTEHPPPGNGVPAALVQARRGGEVHRGWVSSGGPEEPLQTLELGRDHILTMAPPEPKSIASDLSVFTRQGQRRRGPASVNHPLSLGPWLIYQRSYDLVRNPALTNPEAAEEPGGSTNHLRAASRAGSHYSVLEAVYDPWWPAVRFSLALTALGALAMIRRGRI